MSNTISLCICTVDIVNLRDYYMLNFLSKNYPLGSFCFTNCDTNFHAGTRFTGTAIFRRCACYVAL